MSSLNFDFPEEIDFKIIENCLKQKWDEKHNEGVFNYKLNIQKEEILDGKHRYLIQLNPDRTSKRRSPQVIEKVVSPFNRNTFNFTKVHEKEILIKTSSNKYKNITIIINNSPLTQYHSLICPYLDQCLPQKLTADGLTFCLDLLLNLKNPGYKIGYNSPGALASVNHLHLHLIYIPTSLYIETLPLIPLLETRGFYKTSDDTIKGFCFRITRASEIHTRSNDACKLVNYLCNQGLAHNVCVTYERAKEDKTKMNYGGLRLFIWPREKLRIFKNLAPFNVGFCEIAGYVTVGCEQLYQSLNEEIIVRNITDELGNPIDEKMEEDVKRHLNE